MIDQGESFDFDLRETVRQFTPWASFSLSPIKTGFKVAFATLDRKMHNTDIQSIKPSKNTPSAEPKCQEKKDSYKSHDLA